MNYFYIARFKGPHSRVPIGYEVRFDSTRHFVSVAELEKHSSNPFANEIADAAVADGVCDKFGVTREIIKGLAQEGHFYIECPFLIAKEEEERVRKEKADYFGLIYKALLHPPKSYLYFPSHRR